LGKKETSTNGGKDVKLPKNNQNGKKKKTKKKGMGLLLPPGAHYSRAWGFGGGEKTANLGGRTMRNQACQKKGKEFALQRKRKDRIQEGKTRN